MQANNHSMKEKYDLIDWTLIEKSFTADLSEEESRELGQWLDASDDHKIFYGKAFSAYAKGLDTLLSRRDMDRQLGRLLKRINAPRPLRLRFDRRKAMRAAGYAAMLIPAFVILGILWPFRKDHVKEFYGPLGFETGRNTAVVSLPDGRRISTDTLFYIDIPRHGSIIRSAGDQITYNGTGRASKNMTNTVEVPHGAEYKILMSDKSGVWMNSESSLSFPICFHGKDREVSLTGEAFFSVDSDPATPFIVHTRNSVIEVTGTQFNVNCYDPDLVMATLIEGRLNIRSKQSGQRVNVLPSQTAVVNNLGHITILDDVAERQTAWHNGDFFFENETLENIVDMLSRWYEVEKVSYEMAYLAQVRYTGSIKRNLTLEQVIGIIKKTSTVDIKLKNGNELIIGKIKD